VKRIHCIEHAPFETPGHITDWVVERGHSFSCTRAYLGELFPKLEAFDALVVMGGPMGANDESQFEWLADEKRLIEHALRADKHVLGVCLGAQLMASVLGARVYRNRFKEIGWFPVHATEEGRSQWGLPSEVRAFHWHDDAFDLPHGTVHLAKTAACEHQMFAMGPKVLGIQCHLEVTHEAVEEFLRHGAADLGEGPYIQSPAAMTSEGNYVAAHTLLDAILDRWSA